MATHGLSSKMVKVKKPHLCFSCHRKFDEGTVMQYWTSIYEDEFCSGYTCDTCLKIIDMDDDTSDGIPDGYVNDMRNAGETPEQLLERLTLMKQN
jgi:hypothetical protein